MLMWIFVAALVVSSHGQPTPPMAGGISVPKPPASGIRDEGGFFNRSPGAVTRISDRFRKLESEHGFRMFLMVESVLIGTNAPELAAQLQQAWLPEGNGLVIVFETDNRSLGIGRDIGGSALPTGPSGRVPTHEAAAILSKAREKTDLSLAPELYVEQLAKALAEGFEDYFQRLQAPPPPGRTLRLGVLALGGLALLTLIAILVGSLARLPSMNGERTFRFPKSDRPERLGAPCGGGNVSVRRFRNQ